MNLFEAYGKARPGQTRGRGQKEKEEKTHRDQSQGPAEKCEREAQKKEQEILDRL
jgi:hypothetical protein